MTTPNRPLYAVPEPGGPSALTFPRAGSANHQDDSNTATTDEERHGMSTDNHNQLITEMTQEREDLVADGLEPRGVFGIYNDFTCAVLGLVLDAVVILAVAGYWDNGFIPAWLDTHGHWAWLGAGALGWVLLVEVLGALVRLDDETGRLVRHRRRARNAEFLRAASGEQR